MAAVVPLLATVSGTSTVTLARGYRQLLVKNMDAATTITLAWNGAVGSWPLEARERLGIALTGGVCTFTVTCPGAESWAYLAQG